VECDLGGAGMNAHTSRVIFEAYGYCVCLTKAGLSVQGKGGKGKLLPPSHPQFAEYVEAFDTTLDAREVMDLCRALLR
jgi:hypothetical protein